MTYAVGLADIGKWSSSVGQHEKDGQWPAVEDEGGDAESRDEQQSEYESDDKSSVAVMSLSHVRVTGTCSHQSHQGISPPNRFLRSHTRK